MKLSCVLTAVNTNKLYLESIPIFIKSINILYPDVDVKIILIADSCPDEYLTYKFFRFSWLISRFEKEANQHIIKSTDVFL